MRNNTTLPRELRKCRLCLKKKKGLIYIFEVSGSLKNVALAIKEVLLYEVSLDDQFPPFVCTSCSDKLHEFKEFKKKCDSFRETFKSFLKSKREKTERKPCCSDVKKEEKPVLILKKLLSGFPMVQPVEEIKVLQKSLKEDDDEVPIEERVLQKSLKQDDDEVPIEERDLSCIVRAFPINADGDSGAQDTDPLAVQQSEAAGDGVACIIPKDDKAVIEGGKEEAEEEAVDLPYDGVPFIVSMFPIEADPSIEEAEKDVPMEVPLASEGEGRKLRPRKQINYKLKCSSRTLDDLMESGSSDYSLSEQENSNCSSSDYSYRTRRYSRRTEKPTIAPMQGDAVVPGRSEGSLTSESMREMSNDMKDRSKNNMRRRLQELERLKRETGRVAGGRLDKVGSISVENTVRFTNVIPSLPVTTALTQPKKAVVTANIDRSLLPEGTVPVQGGSVTVPVGNNASNVQDYASLPGGTSLLATKNAVADNAKFPGTAAPEQGKMSGSIFGSLLEKLLLRNTKNAAMDSSCGTEAAGDATNISHSGRKECSSVEPSRPASKPSQSGSDSDWWASDKDSDTSEFFVDDFVDNEMPEPQVINEYLCDVCGKVFNRGSTLYIHLKKHKGDYRFACKKCPKSFMNKSLLEKHMLSHADDRCFKCDKCPKAFKMKIHLQQHGISHTGKRKYPCDHCEDSFRTRWQFASHQKKHEGKVLWSCDCGEKCKSWEELENHKKEHMKNRTFKCDICSKLCTKKELLVRHSMTHTKPFQCSICDKGFSRPDEKVHHEAMHRGERKFECDVCGLKFFRKSTMTKHRRDIHIEVQKYKCQFCSFRTKYKFEWKKHENRHRKKESRNSRISGSKVDKNPK